MALLFLDSLRGIVSADSDSKFVFLNTAAADWTIATASPRWTTGSYATGNAVNGEYILIKEPTWPLYIECGYQRASGSPYTPLVDIHGWQGGNTGVGSAAHFGGIAVCADGTISLQRKYGANDFRLLAVSTKALKYAWHRIAIYWDIDSRADGANGTVTVYVDGVEWLTYTGILVYNISEDDYLTDVSHQNYIQFSSPTTYGSPSAYVTDISICDSSGADHIGFLGDVDIETLRPDGAGNYSQFTPLAGNNYQNVDETTPDGDTTYNSSSTVNHRDSYSMTSLARASGDIKAVMVQLDARIPESTTAQALIFLRAGGADLDGTAQPINQAYRFKRQVFNVNAGGSSWDIASINAMEAGLKRE